MKIMFAMNGVRKIKSDPNIKKSTNIKNESILSNRFVIRLKNENLINLSFGELWQKSKSDIDLILKKRNLEIEKWEVHPLL